METLPSGGMGMEVISSFDRGGHGMKSLISKSQSKSRIDLLVEKKPSIEMALRQMRPQEKVL